MTPPPPRPRRRIPHLAPVPPGRGGRLFTALALTLAAAALLSVVVVRCQGPGAPPPEPWTDGSLHGRWLSVFNGHGTNTGDDGSLSLSPRAAEDRGTTHAGLVVSIASYRDVRYEARMRTVRQLRDPGPNPWEVPWLVWAYTDPEHFYYVTLKPNGWELGKRDPAYPGGQRFLATGRRPYPVGAWYAVRVRQDGAVLTVEAGGRRLVMFTDIERPYAAGRVGAYTEDATVRFEGLIAHSG
ncbi:calcium-binding protein [Streptomyces sp. YIM S03343]